MRFVQVPQAVNDLYRDMRDRRLLIPAIALVVAALAVPILLTSDAPAPPPSAAPGPTDAVEPTAAEPAVLTEQTGIRDYRQRLAELKERNPFESNFKAPKTGGGNGAGAGVDTPATEAPENADVGSTVGPVVDGGGSSPTAPTPAPPTDSAAPVETGDGNAAEDSGPGEDVEGETTESSDDSNHEVRLVGGTVDVKVGPIGDNKTIEGVSYLDFLPSKKKPIATFIGVSEGGGAAVFAISRQVSATKGDGSCVPKSADGCEFLLLEIGEERMLTYEPDGTTYRLKLIGAQAAPADLLGG